MEIEFFDEIGELVIQKTKDRFIGYRHHHMGLFGFPLGVLEDSLERPVVSTQATRAKVTMRIAKVFFIETYCNEKDSEETEESKDSEEE